MLTYFLAHAQWGKIIKKRLKIFWIGGAENFKFRLQIHLTKQLNGSIYQLDQTSLSVLEFLKMAAKKKLIMSNKSCQGIKIYYVLLEAESNHTNLQVHITNYSWDIAADCWRWREVEGLISFVAPSKLY